MLNLMTLLVAGQALATPQLEPMAFLVGHCWRGEFATGARDTHCFEPAYGGHYVRDRHEVTGGREPYGGETLYHFDPAAGRVAYTYWNSRGGVSRGSMTPRAGLLDFGDEVHRGADGREQRISTRWRRIDDNSYEVQVGSGLASTGLRTIRYARVAAPAVGMSEVRAPDGSTNLVHETLVDAPPERVYEAISSAAGWRSWAVPQAWASAEDPDVMETSYNREARAGDGRNIRQRFLLRVPHRLVAFRTIQAPPGFPHAEAFYRVTHVFELAPAPSGGTHVRLTGIGYPAGAPGDTLLGFFRDGNRTSLDALRQRLAPAASASTR